MRVEKAEIKITYPRQTHHQTWSFTSSLHASAGIAHVVVRVQTALSDLLRQLTILFVLKYVIGAQEKIGIP